MRTDARSIRIAPEMLFAIELNVYEEDRAIEDLGAVGYVWPGGEFFGGVADAVVAGDEDHAERSDLGHLLGVVDCAAKQVHGGETE